MTADEPVPLTADAIRRRTFVVTKFREGYDPREVDDFLDRAAAAVAALEAPGMLARANAAAGGDPHTLTAEQVERQRFSPTKFRRGYDADHVDDFLDQLIARLRQG